MGRSTLGGVGQMPPCDGIGERRVRPLAPLVCVWQEEREGGASRERVPWLPFIIYQSFGM